MSEHLPLTGYWEEGVELPAKIRNASAVAVGPKIYSFGGMDTDKPNASKDNVFILDTETNIWSYGTPMTKPRTSPGCVHVDDKIYCIGGECLGDKILDLVEVYDIELGTWETLSPLPTAVCQCGCIEKDGKIYCIGGYYTNTAYSKAVQIYDIETDKWESGPQLPQATINMGVALVDNRIYIYGSGSDGIQILDIEKNEWRKGATRPTRANIFGCKVLGNYIYFFGPSDWPANNIFIYHIETDTWSMGVSSAVDYYGFSCHAFVPIKNKIYALWSPSSSLKNITKYTFGNTAITQFYLLKDSLPSTTAAPTTVIPVEKGQDYVVTGPAIKRNNDWYDVVGYHIDENPMIEGSTVSLKDVQIDHSIYFIYGVSKETFHTVTEQYHTIDSTPIKASVAKGIAQGKQYAATAPAIERYTYVGYKVNDGELQPGRTASISNVTGDHTITFIYEEIEVEVPPITLTEQFLNADGTHLQPQNVFTPEKGSDYQNTAPRLLGYKRVGHKIDDGQPQTTRTARLTDIQESHVVTFLYEPCDGENCIDYEYTITESYYDVENGEFILPDTYEYLDAGDGYRKTAPRLTGYNRVGHRIDDGEAVTTRTAVIDDVQANHHVFFLYEPCDGENCIDVPGGPGDGENPDPGPGGGGENPDPGPGGGGENPDPGPGGSGENPDPGPGGSSCNCGDQCHCGDCTCDECTHGGGNPNPGPGGGGDGENPDPGPGGGGDGENPDPGPGGGGGDGENPDPGPGGGGDGENPDPGPGGGGDGDGNGGGGNGSGTGDCCCCCKDSCMPTMTINIPIRRCNNRLIKTVAQALCDGGRSCCCCCCGETTKPTTPTPEPGDEDDVDDCNDPI